MRPCRPVLTRNDYEKLSIYVEDQVFAKIADYESLSILRSTLRGAQVVESDRLARNVVKLQSQIVLRDVETSEAEDYRLVAPDEADISRRQLSALAPLGAMVLGQQVGSTVRVPCPFGWRTVCIERIAASTERAVPQQLAASLSSFG